jgi:hypothetical protein
VIRSDRIHEIATNSGAVMSSLDDDGISQLCERLNTESQKVEGASDDPGGSPR